MKNLNLDVFLCMLLMQIFAGFGCSLSATYEDFSSVDLEFQQPNKNTYQNKTGYEYKVALATNGVTWHLENASLKVYESDDCTGDLVFSNPLASDGSATVPQGVLKGDKKYSARVEIISQTRKERSGCSSWVGVDLLAPDLGSFVFPKIKEVTSAKAFTTLWSEGTDNGISGLSEKPYKIVLYEQANCLGPIKKTASVSAEQNYFSHLSHGITYSMKLVTLDKAGNESLSACSPPIEIDEFMPGFSLSDSTSSPGYSRVIMPAVEITNDSRAAYWCFTEDLNFVPVDSSSLCPGGAGGVNGWYDSRPTELPLSPGEGSKVIKLWLVDSDGKIISNNPPSVAITRDSIAPGAPTVLGVLGGSDMVLDAWLTSMADPHVKWRVGADTEDVKLEIFDLSSNLVCHKDSVPSDTLETDISSCNLANNTTYTIRVTAFDQARNPQVAPDFNFSVKRDPPGPFLIQGISGGTDTHVDQFLGTALPVVHLGTSATASLYVTRITSEDGSQEICNQGLSTSTSVNYATAPGALCLLLTHGSTYRVEAYSQDAGMLRTTAVNQGFKFVVDRENPILSIDEFPPSLIPVNEADISFTSSDDLSGIDVVLCSLDSAPFSACVSPLHLTNLSEGAHQLTVKVLDMAGNQSVQSTSWIVDLTDPVLTLTSQPNAKTNLTSLSVSFVTSDVNGIDYVECALDDGDFENCTSPSLFTADPGTHSYHVRAYDKTGRSTEKIATFLIDTTPPVVNSLTGPANPDHNNTNPVFNFTVSDAGGSGIYQVQCSMDGGAYANCTSPYTTSLAAGNHVFTLKVVDGAGNVTTASQSWTLYTYTWNVAAWGACSAAQPTWQVGGWSGCSVGQPAYQYGGWGSCSAVCGGGTQWRGESCPVVGGSQSRSVSCPTNSGSQNRSVTCLRNDGATVADTYCLAAKPAVTQACSRNDCAGGAPAGSQACTRGGGGDCYGQQNTAQSCNPQACSVYFDVYTPPSCGGHYCYCGVGGGQCAVPSQGWADLICQARGYNRAQSFATAPGPNGLQCDGTGGGCFNSANPSCNIVCTSVTCTNY